MQISVIIGLMWVKLKEIIIADLRPWNKSMNSGHKVTKSWVTVLRCHVSFQRDQFLWRQKDCDWFQQLAANFILCGAAFCLTSQPRTKRYLPDHLLSLKLHFTSNQVCINWIRFTLKMTQSYSSGCMGGIAWFHFAVGVTHNLRHNYMINFTSVFLISSCSLHMKCMAFRLRLWNSAR